MINCKVVFTDLSAVFKLRAETSAKITAPDLSLQFLKSLLETIILVSKTLTLNLQVNLKNRAGAVLHVPHVRLCGTLKGSPLSTSRPVTCNGIHSCHLWSLSKDMLKF